MILLTHFEAFSQGLYYEIYDFKIFVNLTPKELSEILNSLEQFVKNEKDSKVYEFLFNDFLHLIKVIDLCIKKKIEGEKILKKNKKIKVYV
jgi:hypothetical protein